MGRMSGAELKTGELATRCGVSPDTIRFYEREGLLPRPRRTPSQYRLCGEEDGVARMRVERAAAAGSVVSGILASAYRYESGEGRARRGCGGSAAPCVTPR